MDVDKLFDVAKRVHASGLCPPDVRTPEACFAVMLAGAELGFQPMQSLRSLAIVKGKISLSADAQIALCVRSPVCKHFRLIESTDQRATYETHRDGYPEVTRLTWTFAQATRAGLTSSGTWKAHPEAMLRARCAAALARAVYPDVVAGIYDPDETREIQPPAPAVREEPSGSRAFAAYVAAVEICDSVLAVNICYRDLLAGLHEEGADPQEYLEGAGGAYALAAAAIRRRVSINEAELRAVLASETGELARSLDAVAEHAADLDTAARWWVRCGAIFSADHKPIAWRALARTVARIDATDAVATGRATSALKAACAALTPPEPPTGTDAPSAATQTTATGDSAQSTTADAPAAWSPVTTSDGVVIDDEASARRHISALNVWALRASYARHTEPGWRALVVEAYAARAEVTRSAAALTLASDAARRATAARDERLASKVRRAA
jgi:hypothetical protein